MKFKRTPLVKNKSFVGGHSGMTNDGVNEEDYIEDGRFYIANGGVTTHTGCLCSGGSTGNGSDTYSDSCC